VPRCPYLLLLARPAHALLPAEGGREREGEGTEVSGLKGGYRRSISESPGMSSRDVSLPAKDLKTSTHVHHRDTPLMDCRVSPSTLDFIEFLII
jgi:hypothetical protein